MHAHNPGTSHTPIDNPVIIYYPLHDTTPYLKMQIIILTIENIYFLVLPLSLPGISG